MAASVAIIMLLGLPANKIFEKLKMPGLWEYLYWELSLRTIWTNWLQTNVNASADLRKIALIIILLRAGLGINKNDLKKVGGTALKMSCIPGLVEGFFIAFASVRFLNLSFIQGGILGFIVAAVSPAVVVPSMLNLIENVGQIKGIPTLILTGASIMMFAITIFSIFL